MNKFFSLSISKAFKLGFFHLLSANIMIQIAGFGGQIFLTRILTVQEIGFIKVLQSYLGILIVIAMLGVDTAILKLSSEKISLIEKRRLLKAGLIINIIVSAIIIGIVYFLANFELLSSSAIINESLKIFVFQIPLLTLSGLAIMYLQAQKKVKQISSVQSISKFIVVVVTTITAYFAGFIGYIHSLVITNIFTFLLILPLLKSELRHFLKVDINIYIFKSILKIGSFAFGANLIGSILMYFNVILANILVGDTEEIAYYGIAQLLISTLMMAPTTLNQIMIPHISEVSKDNAKVLKLLKEFRKRAYILISLVCVLSSVLIPVFLPIVFGEDYQNSIKYFYILLFGLVFWSVYSPKAVTLLSVGRTDLNFYTSVVSLFINLGFNLVLIKSFGMLGAAVANTVTYFITIFINSYFFRLHFRKG